ncbi:uncharacterized protein LOC143034950 [Oratosquilla oratoria]|uniref:uncharacterized protein LOC143034950 n=1 Tax=Oratosquilla oratoria TaxID=337810 RepID=UPI003F767E30
MMDRVINYGKDSTLKSLSINKNINFFSDTPMEIESRKTSHPSENYVSVSLGKNKLLIDSIQENSEESMGDTDCGISIPMSLMYKDNCGGLGRGWVLDSSGDGGGGGGSGGETVSNPAAGRGPNGDSNAGGSGVSGVGSEGGPAGGGNGGVGAEGVSVVGRLRAASTTIQHYNNLTEGARSGGNTEGMTTKQHYNDWFKGGKNINKDLMRTMSHQHNDKNKEKNTNKEKDKSNRRHERKSLSLNLKRSKFWTSLHNKTMELPERLRKDEKKVNKVPRLQIWLSSDQTPRETRIGAGEDAEQQVLNNRRDTQLPRIHLERPRPIYRSSSEGNRRGAQSGTAGHHCGDNIHLNTLHNSEDRPKSPVGKQPTWPMSYSQFLHQRPKLTHQDRLNFQQLSREDTKDGGKGGVDGGGHGRRGEGGGGPSGSGGGTRRLELPRQNAVAEEAEVKEDPLRHGSMRSDSLTTDCCPPKDYPTLSVFSLSDTGSISRGSSRFSLYSDASIQPQHMTSCSSMASSYGRANSRSNSFNVGYSTAERTSSVRLTIPVSFKVQEFCSLLDDTFQSSHAYGENIEVLENLAYLGSLVHNSGSESCRPRRPSLLSLRSLGRSPFPYVSMDYDFEYQYDYDYDYYIQQQQQYPTHLSYNMSETIPKLSFTQKLAFPTLTQNSIDRPKPRDPYMEAEHNMNTFAKIITIVVLTLVFVLVVGVIYKLTH